MKEKLLIIGASGHGKVIADIALKMNRWQSVAFLDDDDTIKKSIGLEVIGKTSDAFKYKNEAEFFVAIGNNTTRERIQEQLEENGLELATLIHPNAVIGIDVVIGTGTVVMPGAVINCCSIIGKGCIINSSSSVDHDNVIEDYVHVSPGANLAGTVTVGKGSWIGIGSSISNNVRICKGCIVGAGAVVVKDINEQGTYVGVPVRRVD